MRRNQTPAEATLWDALRGRKLEGHKFRRQHPLGRFILDFCCPEERLVIEIDGAIHETQRERDETRSDRLRAYGYQTVRLTNDEVLHDLAGVIEAIRLSLGSERNGRPTNTRPAADLSAA